MTQEQSWVLAEAFDRAAPSYDAMVALSPGYHDQLLGAADGFVQRLPPHPDPAVVDLGCGSGASTAALLSAWTANGHGGAMQLTGVDASAGMLAQARDKQWPSGVRFVEDDAIGFLRGCADASLDGIFAAYLLRNVADRNALVDQLRRVLRPGGVLAVHDYSVAGNLRARLTWAAVCHGIIIPLAALKRSDVPLHRYLYTSVRDFDSVEQICGRLLAAGLVDVRHRSYPGWQNHLVHTVVATAP